MAVDKSEKIPIPARIAPSPPSAPSKVGNPSYIPPPVRIDPSPPPSYESTQPNFGAAMSHAPPNPKQPQWQQPIQQPQWQQPIQQPQPQHVSVNIHNTSSSAQPAQVVYVPNFGHRPVNMVCPHCKIHVRTGTESEIRAIAWISCLIMFFTL
ncbi:hypothetical protein TCAL_16622 [Tigriopus californicus]|uniref:LITAF domain-containing protein n=1 Tax=Tigriopus californicus TaxID=6832 RepID=A0A553NFP0_TIGCA|nr:hypothetical protein TCAL_16622 [Tigriopus californicus]